MKRDVKIIFWLILALLFLQWAIPFAQKVQSSRYTATEQYDQRTTQENYDDISRRLQDLEGR